MKVWLQQRRRKFRCYGRLFRKWINLKKYSNQRRMLFDSFHVKLLKLDLLNWVLCVQDHIFVRGLLSNWLGPWNQCLNLATSWLDWVNGWVNWILQQKVFLVVLSLMISYKKWRHNSCCVRLSVKFAINWLPELTSCGCSVYWRYGWW